MFSLLPALLLPVASAATLSSRWATDGSGFSGSSSGNTAATCRSFYASIYANATNVDLESVIGGLPANEQVFVQLQIETYAAGSTVMAQIAAAGPHVVSNTYQLYFEYCEPTSGKPDKVFQTIHGIVGNAAYWNVIVDGNANMSFAEAAAQQGWATLSYDRLGVGNSSHPNGITDVQINYEIAQAIAIGQALGAGTLDTLGAFGTKVAVGHSYGSNMLTGVAAMQPDLYDALVLTGFTGNATNGPLGLAGFGTTIANVSYPERFPYGSDYLSTPSVSADQMGFFHYPNYTQAALSQFTNTKGEYTIGEINTISGPLMLNRTSYTKPTFVVTGDYDAPYCAANCSVTSLGANMTQLDTARTVFPAVAAADFGTYVVPDTGHGINFHTTAYMAYEQIFSFISSHNL